VRVEIVGGRRAGERYVTDERGLFTTAPVSESDLDLVFSKDDFTEARYSVRGLTANRTIDVEMTAQFIVYGVVHWPKPDENTVVPGARVEIATGQRTGERYITDERGMFKLPSIGEVEVTLVFSKDEFDEARYTVSGLNASRAIDVELTPQRISGEWSGTIGGRPDVEGRVFQLDSFEIHRQAPSAYSLRTGAVGSGARPRISAS